MDCIFSEYIKFVNDFLMSYYRKMLDSKYEKAIVEPFVTKYIDVRYYNKTDLKDMSFTKKIDRELKDVFKNQLKSIPKRSETIKNVFALFSYVLFIDGISHFKDINTLLKTMFSDENITLEYTPEIKNEIGSLIKKYIKKKVDFFQLFNSGEFFLKGKKIEDNLYSIDLGQKCDLPDLYSKNAVERAYNSDVVFENRIYLALVMLSSKILSEVISLKFNNSYVLDFPGTLFRKPKKIVKFTKLLKDDLLKEKVNLKIKYKDYMEFKRTVNELIKEGYSIALELDETYVTDFENLYLFSNIFISKNASYYGTIINNKDAVKTHVITM